MDQLFHVQEEQDENSMSIEPLIKPNALDCKPIVNQNQAVNGLEGHDQLLMTGDYKQDHFDGNNETMKLRLCTSYSRKQSN